MSRLCRGRSRSPGQPPDHLGRWPLCLRLSSRQVRLNASQTDLPISRQQTTNKQTSSVCSDLTVMIPRSTITRAQLLAEAAELVQSAVKRGLMSYPHGTKFQANGTPIPNLDGGLPITHLEPGGKHNIEICRKAFELRDRGLALHDVAKLCNVPKGSVHYLIAKGHEDYLSQQRHGKIDEPSDLSCSNKKSPNPLPETGERETPSSSCDQ